MNKETNIKCVCCGKLLKRLHKDAIHAPEIDMWNNAGVHTFVPGYGSRYDMTEMIIGICDDCIEQKIKEGLLIFKER